MLPLVVMALGGVGLVTGLAILRSLGAGYRIGRLMATAPHVSVAEAVRIAAAGERRYVAIEGRIESDAEFEDAAHQPLVLRRTRLDARLAGRWARFEESLEAVPFEIRDGLDGIAIDATAVGDGLVVIPRESRGLVRDLADRAPATLPPDAPARATIDQVSSVEHATILGWPTLGSDGRPVMTAGLGRPLVLSTLETPEAMRVLARGERLRPRLAAASLAIGGALVILGLAAAALTALGALGVLAPPMAVAADPAVVASPVPTGLGGDTRSSGQGPGLVGAPGAAILAVLLLGLAVVAVTLLYVRATGGPRGR